MSAAAPPLAPVRIARQSPRRGPGDDTAMVRHFRVYDSENLDLQLRQPLHPDDCIEHHLEMGHARCSAGAMVVFTAHVCRMHAKLMHFKWSEWRPCASPSRVVSGGFQNEPPFVDHCSVDAPCRTRRCRPARG